MYYYLNGLMRIPCRFNLRKFPFATQECVLNLWFQESPGIHFVKYSGESGDGEIDLPKRVTVGEYMVRRCYTNEFDDSTSVALFIQLDPFYSYHLLNSFFTSLLIILISFATFFFRTDDFNERIMVSLTALLVLTALFTQASSAMVQTPYLKLLDIWYAVLIACTFLNVIFVTGLNSLNHKMKSNVVSCFTFTKESQMELVVKKMRRYNFICFTILLGGFGIFCFFFVLYAADVI